MNRTPPGRVWLLALFMALMLPPLPFSHPGISPALADGGGGGGGGGGDGGGDGDGDGGGDGGDGGGDGGDGGDGGGEEMLVFDTLDMLAEIQSDTLFEEFTLKGATRREIGNTELPPLATAHWGQSALVSTATVTPVASLDNLQQLGSNRHARPDKPAHEHATNHAPGATTPAPMPVDYAQALRLDALVSDTDDDIAVIIGNKAYAQSADIPPALPAVNDATAFETFAKRALQIKPGNIMRLENASQAQFIALFGSERSPKGKLHDWVRPGRSRVYVYYSGHGAPGESDGYLIPADSDSNRIELNGYPLSTLYRNLDAMKARSTVVVLESCFSGVAQSGTVIKKASPLYIKPDFQSPPKSISIFAASQSAQIASWSPDNSRGLFTSFLLKGFSGEADKKPFGNADGKVSTPEIKAYLDDTLTYWARRHYGRDQHPVLIGDLIP